jgi:hypothetical protein
MAYIFQGDFDFLPLRAHLLYGAVPEFPTEGDFAMAATAVASDPNEAAAHWQIEAIRARRSHSGAPLNELLSEINRATSARLYKQYTS